MSGVGEMFASLTKIECPHCVGAVEKVVGEAFAQNLNSNNAVVSASQDAMNNLAAKATEQRQL